MGILRDRDNSGNLYSVNGWSLVRCCQFCCLDLVDSQAWGYIKSCHCSQYQSGSKTAGCQWYLGSFPRKCTIDESFVRIESAAAIVESKSTSAELDSIGLQVNYSVFQVYEVGTGHCRVPRAGIDRSRGVLHKRGICCISQITKHFSEVFV